MTNIETLSKLVEDIEILAKLEHYVRESAEIVRSLNFDALSAQGYREVEALILSSFERTRAYANRAYLRA
ncbi:MAG TPA: hypothetical protein VGM92_11715 [Candidatus Kapabacteria bacterium]|jgi:hypothetical protein